MVTYLVVDAGVGRAVGDGLEGRARPAAVGGRGHLPGEVHLGLVDAGLLAAAPGHRVLWVVGVAGGHAHQGVPCRRGLLTALLHLVVVGQRHHLEGGASLLLVDDYRSMNVECLFLKVILREAGPGG